MFFSQNDVCNIIHKDISISLLVTKNYYDDRMITMAEIGKYDFQIINVVALRYIELKCAIIML